MRETGSFFLKLVAARGSSSLGFQRRYLTRLDKAEYDFRTIEKKWQEIWNKQQEVLREKETFEIPSKDRKMYILAQFPYPSGHLHMGHVRVYTIVDTLARLYRLMGKQVLSPMGWDAFGLPAENAAIERRIQPRIWTEQNIAYMKRQMMSLGVSFDWSRELSTHRSDYYRWTQWIFLKMYEHRLAYQKEAHVNWDPIDQTVLADEQVDEQGRSWRSGAIIEKRRLKQWFFKITEFADELLKDLDSLDWPDKVKHMQRNWIGKSSGTLVEFPIIAPTFGKSIHAYTTTPETLADVTFLKIPRDHQILCEDFVSCHVREKAQLGHSSFRPDSKDDLSSFDSGICVKNPLTNASIPVFISDHIPEICLSSATMGMPTHNEQDEIFARRFHLPIKPVHRHDSQKATDSNEISSNLSTQEFGNPITQSIETLDWGKKTTVYKLRDWLISRQRYWGVPIPIIYCTSCGTVPVPESDLPVRLPEEVLLSGKGNSPLANVPEWLHVPCPKCGQMGSRETDTMDTFVDSSWYFLRYCDPKNPKIICNENAAKTWMPVDIYVGGIEHAILHLLYSRFILKFLNRLGIISDCNEPFKRLITQGMVQGRTFKDQLMGHYLKPEEVSEHPEDPKKFLVKGSQSPVMVTWEKMSKSKYNGIDPNHIMSQVGSDAARAFILFKAPIDQALEWDQDAIQGQARWLRRVYRLVTKSISSPVGSKADSDLQEIRSATHHCIKQVTRNMSELCSFNVAIANLMELTNTLEKHTKISSSYDYRNSLRSLLIMMSPITPHIASELWWILMSSEGELDPSKLDVSNQNWPVHNEHQLRHDFRTIAIQLNGKLKGVLSIPISSMSSNQEIQLAVEQSPIYHRLVEELKSQQLEISRVVIARESVVNYVTNRPKSTI